jgi:ATP-dependent Clp protease ATP-binding subunit ClpC
MIAMADIALLDQLSTNLTVLAREGRLDPIIERTYEIEQLASILSQDNHVLLVGNSEVITTAIVEGLAQFIAKGKVPELLLNRIVRQLDLGILAHKASSAKFDRMIEHFIKTLELSESILYIHDLNIVITLSKQEPIEKLYTFLELTINADLLCIGALTPVDLKALKETDADLVQHFRIFPL